MQRLKEKRLHTEGVDIRKFEKTFLEIEEILSKRKKIPPLGSLVSVSELKKKLNQLKVEIEEALNEHHKIVKKSEEIIKKSNNILRKAKKDSEEALEEFRKELWQQPIIQQAEQKAKELLLEAKMKRDKILEEANNQKMMFEEETLEYTSQTLDEVEEILLHQIRHIRENKEMIKKAKNNNKVKSDESKLKAQ